MWSEPRRAHPAGIIEYAIRYLRASVAPVFGVLVTVVAVQDIGAPELGWLPAAVIILLLAALVAIGAAVVRWRRFTFRVEDGSFRVEQGLLVRKSTRIAPKRIQSVDTRANLLFRVLGLVTVEIHTAGRGQGPEVWIPALTEDEARDLAATLRRSGEAPPGEALLPGEPSAQAELLAAYSLTGRELAIMGLTSSGGLLVLAAVGSLVPLVVEGA
ncbi:MAG TPA: PH domain-containing protein, partial [Desulfobacterales bacterium]|nr:PH domain-containing protein [Desulfobacterales bacterium]